MKDSFGLECNIGDFIIFNPPKYKGLCKAEVIGFTKSNCPMVVNLSTKHTNMEMDIKYKGFYSVKTDYVKFKL